MIAKQGGQLSRIGDHEAIFDAVYFLNTRRISGSPKIIVPYRGQMENAI